jgi:hypothetical protein
MNPLKILADLIYKLILYVNGLGQPKVKDHTVKNESISAIKIKVKTVEEYKESPWVKNENKQPKTNSIVTGTTQSKVHMSDPYTFDMWGLSSTSMYHKTGDKHLDDILSGGYNVMPVDMTPKPHKKVRPAK